MLNYSILFSKWQELLKKKKNLEKLLAEKERLAYINPKIAQKEKELGNELFKEG